MPGLNPSVIYYVPEQWKCDAWISLETMMHHRAMDGNAAQALYQRWRDKGDALYYILSTPIRPVLMDDR
jgi:hypothetical protein